MEQVDGRERDVIAEEVCCRLGDEIEKRGATSGASTVLSTVIRGPDRSKYTCSVTVLVNMITDLTYLVEGEQQ